MATLLVADIIKEKQNDLELVVLAGAQGQRRPVVVSEINRPGLALSGYLDYFPSERVQIMGLGEHTYLSTLTPPARRAEVLERTFAYKNAALRDRHHARNQTASRIAQGRWTNSAIAGPAFRTDHRASHRRAHGLPRREAGAGDDYPWPY